MLTLADYSALKKVYDDRRDLEFKRWAVERVDFRNAHRMFEEGVPWTLADMIGERDREAAVKEARSDKAKREMALMKLQRGLGSITSGKAPEELLPDWAKRQWDPADYPEIFGGKAAN